TGRGTGLRSRNALAACRLPAQSLRALQTLQLFSRALPAGRAAPRTADAPGRQWFWFFLGHLDPLKSVKRGEGTVLTDHIWTFRELLTAKCKPLKFQRMGQRATRIICAMLLASSRPRPASSSPHRSRSE